MLYDGRIVSASTATISRSIVPGQETSEAEYVRVEYRYIKDNNAAIGGVVGASYYLSRNAFALTIRS